MAGTCGKVLIVLLLMPIGTAFSQDCTAPTGVANIRNNAIEVGLMNSGQFWYHNWFGNVPYRFEANGVLGSMIYTGGLWFAGKNAQGAVGAAANWYFIYGNDFFPGPVFPDRFPSMVDCFEWDRFFTAERKHIVEHIQLSVTYQAQEGGTIPVSKLHGQIRNWPARGNPWFTLRTGTPYVPDTTMHWAPFIDTDEDGIYDPTKGDHPDIKGDYNLWWIFNDAGGQHGSTKSDPLGIQVSVLAYWFDTSAPIGNTSFFTVDISSPKGLLDSLYIGMFVDFDLGYGFDDFIACDTGRHMGIGVNGRHNDQVFGIEPPQLVVRILDFPIGENDQPIGMTSFRGVGTGFTATGGPFPNATPYWKAMQGVWLDGTPQTYGGGGHGGTVPFPWMFPGNPHDPQGWSECTTSYTYGDRRFLMSTGPLSLVPKVSHRITYAVISAECTAMWDGQCYSTDCIKAASDEVQDFFKAQRPVGISGSKSMARHPKLYPNPTEGLLNINWPEASTGGTLELLNHIGQRVAAWPAPVIQIHIGHLPAGWYLLRYQKSNETWQAPVVKY